MSCLNAEFSLLNKSTVLNVDRYTKGKSAPINISVSNTSSRPSVSFSIVCSLKELKNYLKVSPSDVQWITEDYGVVYNVESDMDWIVITT